MLSDAKAWWARLENRRLRADDIDGLIDQRTFATDSDER